MWLYGRTASLGHTYAHGAVYWNVLRQTAHPLSHHEGEVASGEAQHTRASVDDSVGSVVGKLVDHVLAVMNAV